MDYLTNKLFIKELGRTFSFYIWDTAGQELYDAITKRYYRGADAAIIVFSITDRGSYIQIPFWYEKVLTECGHIPTIVVMNKIDLIKESVVTYQEAFKFVYSMKLEIMLCSSKDNIRVKECFEKVAVMYFQEHFIVEVSENEEESNHNKKHNCSQVNDNDGGCYQSDYVYTNNSTLQGDGNVFDSEGIFHGRNWGGGDNKSFKLKIVKKKGEGVALVKKKKDKVKFKDMKC